MNIQQLEYIIAVDKHRHFSKAAEASFVTQPTLSMMIQKLEEELDVKIFDRTQLPIVPTEIGRRIIDQARVTMEHVHQIKEIVNEERSIIKGVFRLGIIPTVAPYLLPKLMERHSGSKNDIRISIQELTTEQIIESLSNNSLHGAILATPLGESDIKEYPLYYEQFYAYVSPLEKALYAQTSIEKNDLNKVKLWMLDEVHCFRTQIMHLCEQKRLRASSLPFSFEAGSISTLINIVDRNEGVTIIPEMAIATLSEKQMKNVRPFKNATPVREISLITRKDYLRERLINILINEILSVIPDSLKDNAMRKYVVPL